MCDQNGRSLEPWTRTAIVKQETTQRQRVRDSDREGDMAGWKKYIDHDKQDLKGNIKRNRSIRLKNKELAV